MPLMPSEWLAVRKTSGLADNNMTLLVLQGAHGGDTGVLKKSERLETELPPSMLYYSTPAPNFGPSHTIASATCRPTHRHGGCNLIGDHADLDADSFMVAIRCRVKIGAAIRCCVKIGASGTRSTRGRRCHCHGLRSDSATHIYWWRWRRQRHSPGIPDPVLPAVFEAAAA